MSTEEITRLAKSVYRRSDLRVEWRRVPFDGALSVVAMVLADEVDAKGDPRVLTAEVGLRVGEVLEKLETRLRAAVASSPDCLAADPRRALWAWASGLASEDGGAFALTEKHFILAASFRSAAKGFRPHG